MYDLDFFQTIAWTIAGIFALSGAIQFAGPGFVRRAYERWDFPPKFYRVAGLVELLAAAFLAEPLTRVWGVTLAALAIVGANITLLKNRQYAYAVPGILLLIALVPAARAGVY
jgi:DoxX-like family